MSKYLKYIFFLAAVFAGFTVRTALAADVASEQAKRDLSTQTDLLKNTRAPLLTPDEKPVIEEEKTSERQEQTGPVFLVKKIELKGNTVFKKGELDALVRSAEGKKMSFGELERFADTLTAYYVTRGYTTTRAYIPPQKVIDGIVTIEILEGRVGGVEVEGNRWFKKDLYQNAVPFKQGDFFDMATLENAVRDINLQPDRAAKAYLQPGKTPGSTDIVLKTKENLPIHASYEFNLRGTELTNRDRHLVHLTHNNISGSGDSLETSFTMAEQSSITGGVFNYELPIQRTGTTFYLSGAMAESRLQGDLKDLDVQGNSSSWIPGVIQKIWKNAWAKLDWSLQAEIKDSKTTVLGDKLFFDRMRVVTTGPRIKTFDAGGQTMLAGDIHVGIPDFMGSSSENDPLASRVGSGGDFVYGTGSIARVQRLPNDAFFVFQGTGQYSSTPLTSLEQFNLGGMYSVRGYSENDSSGDSGYGLSGEIRIPPYFIPKNCTVPGMKDKTWYNTLSLVVFVDGGQVFNGERQQSTSEKTRTLLGTGAGVRFYVSPDFNIQFDLGFPFGDRSSEDNRPQAHLLARIGF